MTADLVSSVLLGFVVGSTAYRADQRALGAWFVATIVALTFDNAMETRAAELAVEAARAECTAALPGVEAREGWSCIDCLRVGHSETFCQARAVGCAP
jgi:hypothetical protein